MPRVAKLIGLRYSHVGWSALAALLPAAAFAGQPVVGRVLDAATAGPVAGAAVELVGTGQRQSTKTDAKGTFAFGAVEPGTYTLEVRKPPDAFAIDSVTVGAEGPPAPVELLLSAEVESIRIVEVARREPPAPGGAQVVREEITRVPGARGDVLTALQSLPGIANTGSFTPFSGGGIIVRGSAPSDSRVLVDGIEVPILYHFGAVQSILPSEMIEDVVYAPGGFGVEHGRASSGVIEVRTRRGQPELGGFAEVSFINGAAFLQGPIGAPARRATFAVALRRSIIDGILPALLPDSAGLDFTLVPRYYDYQARADWQPSDRLRLGCFVFGTDDGAELLSKRDNPNDPMLTGSFRNDTSFVRGIASVAYEGDRVRNRTLLALERTAFAFAVGENRHLRFSADGVRARDEARVRLGPGVAGRAGFEAALHRFEVDANLPRPPRDGDPQIPNFTFDPLVTRKERAELGNLAAWAAADLEPAPWLSLGVGGRYDGFLRNLSHVFQPRGEAKLGLGATTLRAAGGLYTRPPYWNDEFAQPSLGPERAWQATLGAERELARGVSVQATGFYTWRSDLIVFATNRTDPTRADEAYVNRGTGRSFGAELLASFRGERHFAWLAYTLSRSLRRDGPDQPERLFNFDQTHNLVAVGSRSFGRDKRWQVGGRFQVTTGQPVTPVAGAVFVSDLNHYRPVFGDLYSERAETMHQLDLRVDRVWRFRAFRVSAFLDVQNVYAHAAVINYQYSYDYTQREALRTLPILPSFGLRGEI